jgi:chromosome segregation protein
MAEVSITFDNTSHVLPIDYDEVTVTRRLYRSGDSEYLLNKTPVRLKDITDLMMDTGIGTDAYSVIELKMVEEILSEKAEDRRKLIEEAAGVTKYKHRLKAAIRKQEATQNDLLRVNDIIQEVERTVRSLQRQVAKARQYQRLDEKIRTLDLNRSSQIWCQLQEKIKPLKKKIFDLQNLKEGRTTAITKEETELESMRLELVEKEKGLSQAQSELATVVEHIHQSEGDIRVGRERTSSLGDRINRYQQEIENLKKRLDEQKQHLDMSHRNREALQVKIASNGRLFNNKQMELNVFQQGLNIKRLELNKKKKEIIGCLEEINRIGSEEIRLRARNDNSRGRLERLDEEDAAFQSALKRVEESRNALDEQLRSTVGEYDQFVSSVERTAFELERLQKTADSEKERFYKDQSELDGIKNRQAFLKNIIESKEGMTDGAKKLLSSRPAGLIGVLADVLEALPAHRTAIETGLGEAARYLLFETWSQAISALDTLRQTGGGKVTMVALDRIDQAPSDRTGLGDRSALPQDGNASWAEDLIKTDGRIRSLARLLLGDVVVVPDMDSAKTVIEDSSRGRVRVVTHQGELISNWGIVQTGESQREDVGLIGRRQRIRELEERIGALAQTIAEAEKRLLETEERKMSLLNDRGRLEKQLKSVEERKTQFEKQRDKILFEKEKSEEGLKKNADERQKLLSEIEGGKEALENLRPKMETLLNQREKIEGVTAQIQTDVDRLEGEEKKMEEEVHRLNITVVRLNGEAQNLDFEIERSQKLITEIEATSAQRLSDIGEASQEIERTRTESRENEKRLLEEFSKKESLEARNQQFDEAFLNLREQFQSKEKGIRQVRHDREEVSEQIHALEMEISDLEHQTVSLHDRIHETYQVEIETVTLPEDANLEGADQEIEDLKRRIKALGPVNLVSLQEYEQEKQRLDFLLQQRDDLLSAEQTLQETIVKINQTARDRFTEVFSQVRINFQETFKKFFNGGEADLRLPENEDVLEAQIEIMARPAGKQLRALDLLSGGEKALTAISLLFALYMVKPSPFCILDEIDAPLDDVNVERFTSALSEYAEKTQFVMVTHNKRTMKSAKALYGVTMEEEGVSKIVSVKFEE